MIASSSGRPSVMIRKTAPAAASAAMTSPAICAVSRRRTPYQAAAPASRRHASTVKPRGKRETVSAIASPAAAVSSSTERRAQPRRFVISESRVGRDRSRVDRVLERLVVGLVLLVVGLAEGQDGAVEGVALAEIGGDGDPVAAAGVG